MTARETLARQVTERIELLAPQLTALSRMIHELAEPGFAEHRSVAAIAELVTAHGIEARVGVHGMETSLEACAGDPAGPRIAILAEYDALPGIGHGCGHNIIGAAAAGAFLGLLDVIGRTGGSVVLLGTPAEENGSGKEIMARAGAFAGIDAAIMLHPANCDDIHFAALGLRSVEATYHGIPAHASARPEAGRNALDAVVAAYQGVAALRQHMPQTDRVHGVITEGGEAANIVPARASLRLLIRSPRLDSLLALSERVQRILSGAALITETRLDAVWDRIQPCLPVRGNDALSTRFGVHMAARGRTSGAPQSAQGSTDLGNISLRVPAIHPTLAIAPPEIALHTVAFAGYAGSERGDRAVVDGAVILALTALDFLTDAGLRERSRLEFEAAGGVVDVPALLTPPGGQPGTSEGS
ncbi:amidohydrolase [Streptomyces malaysiensis subsp. malaysiensis]|uniref:amidohydrolase n=1 Tax=Streptomyces malaysiensis TaxID=92644 RepID=UPI0024BFC0E4|nr:amidohydrolase [Streptomyces sp. NA07423]WHX16050.1 amidohydrolase [Streptomyces sp. NA07423]